MTTDSMILSRRRWIVVALGIALVALVEVVSDTIFDGVLPFPWNTFIVVAAVGAAGIVGAAAAFRSIDGLSAALRARNAELEASDASLRALHHVSMSLATLTDIDRILHGVVDNGRTLLDSDIALLVLAGADGTLRLAARSGPEASFDPAGHQPGGDFRRFAQPAAVRSHIAAPVQRAGRSIGTLAVGSATKRAYAVDHIEILASLASQAGVAIENDRLARRLRELAIQGERERIAREMHDGLAQVLGYVNTKSQAVEELLAAGRIETARSQLAELAAAARSVYVDVREAILGLTSPIDPQAGLVEAVEDYAKRFSEASKLVAAVDSDPASRSLRLTPEAKAQTFRIVQEALTNVRKHAAARRVSITFAAAGPELCVTVRDDGRGPAGAALGGDGWPRYGLTSMRDRAAGLGGTVDIDAAAPGTRLRLVLPLAPSLEGR